MTKLELGLLSRLRCRHAQIIHFYQKSCGKHWHVAVCWICNKVLEKTEWVNPEEMIND